MKIDVSSIVKINGASLDVKFDEAIAELNDLETGFVFKDNVRFEGVLTNAGGVLKLNGGLKASYNVKCGRCVKDIEDSLELKIREDIIEGSDAADVDAYTYNDNYILLDSILKDNIILNLPVKKVCDDDCKGLCPRCGANLNEKTCDCKDDYINPQLEVLKKFFDN